MANIYVDLVMIFQNRVFFYRYIATKYIGNGIYNLHTHVFTLMLRLI